MKKTAENRDLDRVLDLLWEKAEAGSVSAQKALYAHYASDDATGQEPQDDWDAIYGDSNVTPIRRTS